MVQIALWVPLNIPINASNVIRDVDLFLIGRLIAKK